MKHLISIFFFTLIHTMVLSQKPDNFIPGSFLIQFSSEEEMNSFSDKIALSRSDIIIEYKGNNVPILSIFEPSLKKEDLEILLKNTDGVIAFQQDSELDDRNTIPNDPLFTPDQWDMMKIKAPEAWDITTGGITPLGHEIVIGIADKGYFVDHADLINAIYTNPDEIPGNGIDDDGNGYLDDVNGVNVLTNSGIHESHFHGAGAMGIIGATGNNGKGMSGVNWKVKILMVSGVNTASLVVKAYDYILGFRQKFNSSHGEEGALIVSTNLSAGRSGFASEYPVWCNLYEIMGQAGIVSAGATANENINVEFAGDMPSTCTSEYLIVVASTDKNDRKASSSGYGTVSVDLGAPGEGTISSREPQGYSEYTGTSSASPHVAGAVALMYAAPNTGLEDLYMDYPAAAARSAKNAILNNVDIVDDLIGKVVSGGRLNLYKMITKFVAESNTLSVIETGIYPNPVKDVLTIHSINFKGKKLKAEIWDLHGKLIHKTKFENIADEVQTDVSTISSGMYVLRIISGDTIGVGRFIKL